MAVQVGMGITRLLAIVGAGYTGTILLKNGKLSDVVAEFQNLFKGGDDAKGGESDLSSQVSRLAEEMRRLAHNRPIVINGNSGQLTLSSLVVPAAAVGAVGYGYMWWKGISFSDLMYVTKRSMATAVENMRKHLEHVSDALAATKRHLSQRIEKVDGKLEEQVEISKLIRADVTDVRGELSHINCELDELHRVVIGLDGKLITLGAKQELANAGVLYLCGVVSGKRAKMPERLLEQLRAAGNSSVPAGRLMGLKELKSLEFGNGNGSNNSRLIIDGVSGDGVIGKEEVKTESLED